VLLEGRLAQAQPGQGWCQQAQVAWAVVHQGAPALAQDQGLLPGLLVQVLLLLLLLLLVQAGPGGHTAAPHHLGSGL
jgi:hypothetical protein